MSFSAQILHSATVGMLVYLALVHPSAGITLHLDHSSGNDSSCSMPEELNVTVYNESGEPTHLNLKQAKAFGPNVPVYTFNVDETGKYHSHRENLQDKENIGYYQDVATETIVQATSTKKCGGKSHLILKGELNIEGQKYTLNPENRVKRDTETSSPSSTSPTPADDVYNLVPLSPASVSAKDYLVPPTEGKKTFVEASPLNAPKLLEVSPASYRVSKPPSWRRPPLPRSRRQTSSTRNVVIDIVAVIDNKAYKRFLSNSRSKTEALEFIREYYAFIFNGVDVRFQSIRSSQYAFRIRLIKIIVAEAPASSLFTESFRQSNVPWDEVDAQKALTSFSEFAADSGRSLLFPYDHAMLFTGYDLISRRTSGGATDGTTGLAYTSTLCRTDGKSTSIVEDLGGFQSVDTATHELGHSCSALHDGDGNNCRSSDRYIMSAGGIPVTDSNKLNSWTFSSCSITAFNNFVTNTLRSTRGQTCLLQQLSISSDIPDVSDRLPGQEFSADDQCRMIYGNSSRMCRGAEFGSASDICTSMFCFDPSTTGTCYGHKAAEGSTCGNGKICLSGQCVSDSRAPTLDDDCLFGDQPGEAFNGQTCPQFVNSFSGYCYQDVVKSRCCASCKKAYRSVSGCEYDDTAAGCTPDICPYISGRTLQQCCGTCNYGSPLPSNSANSPRSNTLTKRQETVRVVTQRPTTTTSQLPTEGASSTCFDRQNKLINNMSCATAVRRLPSICNIISVRRACCLSCRRRQG